MDWNVIIQTALVTFFFSFGIQALFYYYYKSIRSPLIRTHKAVMEYASGIVGDGILMPLTNVFAVLSLGTEKVIIEPYVFLLSISGGFVVFFIMHFGQKYFRLVNWTMPENGKWTLLGVYHAIFMFVESSFLFFVVVKWIQYGVFSLTSNTLYLGFGAMFIFLITFVYDYWNPLFKKILSQKIK